MANLHNVPEIQFCVEVAMPGTGAVVDRFTIEQSYGGRQKSSSPRVVENSVAETLHALHVKTGLIYRVVRSGEPTDQSRWLNGERMNAV